MQAGHVPWVSADGREESDSSSSEHERGSGIGFTKVKEPAVRRSTSLQYSALLQLTLRESGAEENNSQAMCDWVVTTSRCLCGHGHLVHPSQSHLLTAWNTAFPCATPERPKLTIIAVLGISSRPAACCQRHHGRWGAWLMYQWMDGWLLYQRKTLTPWLILFNNTFETITKQLTNSLTQYKSLRYVCTINYKVKINKN